MSNRGLEIGDMVLKGLAANPQLSVVQPGEAVAHGAEPRRQLGGVSFEELRDPSDGAAPAIPLRLGQRGILLDRGKNIRQGGLERLDLSVGRVLEIGVFL